MTFGAPALTLFAIGQAAGESTAVRPMVPLNGVPSPILDTMCRRLGSQRSSRHRADGRAAPTRAFKRHV
jgi:hypothetical protein